MPDTVPPLSCQEFFHDRLVDLGEHELHGFAGVLAPVAEVGAPREGVTDEFLRDAEAYYKRHQGFDYWRGLFGEAFRIAGVQRASTVVEYGCGFGNATLPVLDLLPEARIVATDISPNLLAILRRLLEARGLRHRCVPVAMDAHKPYIKEGIADLVFGSAILHHLIEPGRFVAAAARVLKPGGHAIFFEPFEPGHAILRMVALDIQEEAKRRRDVTAGVKWLNVFADALDRQIKRDRIPGWRNLDDKWVLPRAVLQSIADEAGAELTVYPIHGQDGQFHTYVQYCMRDQAGLDATGLPGWAWKMIDRLDNDIFSPECLRDMLLAGCVIFRKRDRCER